MLDFCVLMDNRSFQFRL